MNHINEYSEFKKSLNEGPGKGYYIKVAVRDAKKALSILDDMYRKKFDISGSDTYYFKDEDMAYDAMMDISARDIEITDTNIEESLDEKAGPCWDGYKIGSPKTKISSQSGKRVNNCVPVDEEVTESVNDASNNLEKIFGTDQETIDMFQRIEDEGTVKDMIEFIDEFGNEEMLSRYGIRSTSQVKKLAKTIMNEATDLNDPVLMAFRATRRELPKFKPAKAKSRRLSFDKYMDLLDAQTDIEQDIKDYAEEMAQTFRDMEQEAEPEGGEMADKYGSIMMKQETEYSKLKAKKAKIDARIEKHRMA